MEQGEFAKSSPGFLLHFPALSTARNLRSLSDFLQSQSLQGARIHQKRGSSLLHFWHKSEQTAREEKFPTTLHFPRKRKNLPPSGFLKRTEKVTLSQCSFLPIELNPSFANICYSTVLRCLSLGQKIQRPPDDYPLQRCLIGAQHGPPQKFL